MNCLRYRTLGLSLLCLTTAGSAFADGARLRGMRLLPGYTHLEQQGFDSLVGEISKKGGLRIRYEIGRVPKPGGFAMGGDFSDRAKLSPKDQTVWYREQVVHGQPVHLAFRKNKVLLASFPDTGMNMHATIQSSEDFADAMLMILTYPQTAGGQTGGKASGSAAVAGAVESDVDTKQDGEWKPAKLPLAGLAEGKNVEVRVRGTLRHGIMAIGGETTGTLISFEKSTWELDLRKNAEFRAAAGKLNGKRVVVTGAVREMAGVEIAKRTILTIDSIDAAGD